MLTSLLLAAANAARVLRAQDVEEVGSETKIPALERVWNQAEMLGDLKALDALLDPDLIYIDADGVAMSKAEFLARARSGPLHRTITELTKVQVFEDTAIVNGMYLSKQFKGGRSVVRQGRFTDTWIHKGPTWVCIAAQVTPILHPAGK